VESYCEFGIEPSSYMKCWETIECLSIVASRVVLSAIVSYDIWIIPFQEKRSPSYLSQAT
jgi:hypothetical protein